MSLLNQGREIITVFPEVLHTTADGNKIGKPSSVGVVCRATVQFISSADDAALVNSDGTKSKYRLRLAGWPGEPLGSKSQVEWQGVRWSLDGEPRVFNGSRRTAHVDYVMVRA